MRLELDRKIRALRAAQVDFFLKKWSTHIAAPSKNPVCVGGHLERGKEAKDTERVGAVERPRFQLYLGSSNHFGNSVFHVVMIVLRPVRQTINAGAHGCLVVCFDGWTTSRTVSTKGNYCLGSYRLNDYGS